MDHLIKQALNFLSQSNGKRNEFIFLFWLWMMNFGEGVYQAMIAMNMPLHKRFMQSRVESFFLCSEKDQKIYRIYANTRNKDRQRVERFMIRTMSRRLRV